MWALLKLFLLVSSGIALGFLFVYPWVSFVTFVGQYLLIRLALLGQTAYVRVAQLGLVTSAMLMVMKLLLVVAN
jgi:hypothetical protein